MAQPRELSSSVMSFNSAIQGHRGTMCQQDISTTTGKRLQLTKILALILVPIVVLSMVMVYTLSESVTERSVVQQNKQDILFSIGLGQFMQSLQRERDMTVFFLSALGPETKTFLFPEYSQTDIAINALSFWPPNLTEQGSQHDVYGSRELFLAYLSRHRQFLDKDTVTVFDEIDFYNDITAIFLSKFMATVSTGKYAKVWRTVVAYAKITIGIQEVGVERALGIYFFANGGFNSQDLFESYNRRLNKFKSFYYTAEMYSADVYNLYKEGYFGTGQNITAMVHTFRLDIQYSEERYQNASIQKAKLWFANATTYLDALFLLQSDLENIIINRLDSHYNTMTTEMIISIVLLVFVFCICPVVVLSTESLTSSIQQYAIKLVNRNKELSREKKKTDTLLYHILPKQVAEKLKRNGQVDAEYFKSATIFFSDIYQFSAICSRSSPIEIVELLNALYTLIDEQLDNRDVYKVETINDCYMVASGLPKRNKNKHSLQIANLVLDLLALVKNKTISTSGNRVIQLRFGVNTGPCMAGVIGTLMPRYCLFGDSVNTAARMMSSGQPNKIHISHDSFVALSKHKCFVMRKRGEGIFIKGKGEMQTFWLLGRHHEETLISHSRESMDLEMDELPGEIKQMNTSNVHPALPLMPGASQKRVSSMSDIIPGSYHGKVSTYESTQANKSAKTKASMATTVKKSFAIKSSPEMVRTSVSTDDGKIPSIRTPGSTPKLHKTSTTMAHKIYPSSQIPPSIPATSDVSTTFSEQQNPVFTPTPTRKTSSVCPSPQTSQKLGPVSDMSPTFAKTRVELSKMFTVSKDQFSDDSTLSKDTKLQKASSIPQEDACSSERKEVTVSTSAPVNMERDRCSSPKSLHVLRCSDLDEPSEKHESLDIAITTETMKSPAEDI